MIRRRSSKPFVLNLPRGVAFLHRVLIEGPTQSIVRARANGRAVRGWCNKINRV
jgi:hypothetical protein